MSPYGVIVNPEDVWEMSLGDVCAWTASKVPDKTAIIDQDRTCTFKELNDMSDAFAAGLLSIGVQKGDRVGIMLQNSIETIVAYVGVAKAGAVTVPINPRYREHELRFLIENSGLSTMITMNRSHDFDFISLFQELQKVIPSLRNIVAMEPGQQSGIYVFNDLVEANKTDKYNFPTIDTKNDNIILMYTSGTTGVPKGAQSTHYQLVRNSSQFIERLEVTADDVILTQLPWFHAFALVTCINLSIITGATMVIQDPYDPGETLKMIEKYKCTIHHGTPAMFLMEMNHKDFNKYDLSSLRTGVASGAAFSHDLLRMIRNKMNLNIISAWGMTELSGGGCSTKLSDPDELKVQTVGFPSRDCKVKICDSNGNELPIGEVGELWFWGWLVTKGYWNNEAETKKQITEDGWLKTGDMCRLLENGYVQYIGRSKEMINRGGYKVFPRELEDMLINHPKVDKVAVVGVPNEVLDDLICAWVIPKDKQNPPEIFE